MDKAVVVLLACLSVFIATPATADEPVYQWKEVVPKKARMSTRWAFVVDTSSSVAQTGLFGGIIQAYKTTTQYPLDELQFCMYAFNDANCHKYKGWEDASVDAFSDAVSWLYQKKNQGTMSYGSRAIRAALEQPFRGLTVVIITDGGFTEGGAKIKKVINSTQKWRVTKGYGEALICTVGIENMLCWPTYPKPANSVCQGWLAHIGKKGNGGYYYVYKRRRKKAKGK